MQYTRIKTWVTLCAASLTAVLLLAPLVSYSQESTPNYSPQLNQISNRINTANGKLDGVNTRLDAANNKLNSILEELQSFHADTIEMLQKFFETSLDYSGLLGNNAAYKLAKEWIIEDSASDTNSDTYTNLTLTTEGYYKTIADSANLINTIITSEENDGESQAFSASSIIDNFALKEGSESMDNAKKYIQTLSGQSNPLMPPTGNMNNAIANSKIPVQQYKAALGTFEAVRSIALNTFYKSLAARTVQADLAKDTGMKDSEGNATNDASPLQLQQHLVQNHFSSDWVETILADTTTPADVQKQQLFVLAEIHNMLFENRMQMEQLNLNIAALILQIQQDATRKGITDMRRQAIRSLR